MTKEQSLQELHVHLSELDKTLDSLRNIAGQISKYCEGKQLIPGELLNKLRFHIESYQKDSFPIYQYCNERELSHSLPLPNLDELLQKEISIQLWAKELVPFYNLSCTKKHLEAELETSKSELKAIFQSEDFDSIKEAILPYWAVLKNVNEDADNDICTLMEKHFSMEFCRAIYRGHINLSQEGNSAEQSSEENTNHYDAFSAPDNVEHIEGSLSFDMTEEYEDIPELETDSPGSSDNNTSPSAKAPTLPINNEPVIENYDGFIDNLTISFEEKKPGPLQTKKFLNDVVHRHDGGKLLFTLARTAYRKVLIPQREEIDVLPEYAEYLFRKGYLTKVIFKQADNIIDVGFCLSQSGLESLVSTKTTSKEYIKRGLIPDYLHPISKSLITPLCAAHARHLHRITLRCRLDDDKYTICNLASKESGALFYLVPISDSEYGLLMSALCTQEDFPNTLEWIKDGILASTGPIVIVVATKQDIHRIAEYLDLPPETAARVFYAWESDNDVMWLDETGNEKMPTRLLNRASD